MEQLILHLIGDYLLQTDWMAKNKRNSWIAALAHATVYSLPFHLSGSSSTAVNVIFWTHLFIDRFGLARYVVFAKNWVTNSSLKWKDCSATGYPKDTPAWMAIWLMIIADNTLHLVINYLALRFL